MTFWGHMGDERRGVHTPCPIQIELNGSNGDASPTEVGRTSHPDVEMEKQRAERKNKQTEMPTEGEGTVDVRWNSRRTHLPDPLSHNQIEGNPAVSEEPGLIGYAPQELVHELFASD